VISGDAEIVRFTKFLVLDRWDSRLKFAIRYSPVSESEFGGIQSDGFTRAS